MDSKYICQKSQPKVEATPANIRSPQPTDTGSSDEDDDEEDNIPNVQDAPTTESKPTSTDEDSENSNQYDDINFQQMLLTNKVYWKLILPSRINMSPLNVFTSITKCCLAVEINQYFLQWCF